MDPLSVDNWTMRPYQKALYTAITSGIESGTELKLTMGGRRTGKSNIAAYTRMMQDILNAYSKVSDMQLGEGTVYGSRYYTVEPVGGNWLEMETWCSQVFGEGSRALWGEKSAPEPARRWYANNRKFWFRSERDRDWFIVMWRA